MESCIDLLFQVQAFARIVRYFYPFYQPDSVYLIFKTNYPYYLVIYLKVLSYALALSPASFLQALLVIVFFLAEANLARVKEVFLKTDSHWSCQHVTWILLSIASPQYEIAFTRVFLAHTFSLYLDSLFNWIYYLYYSSAFSLPLLTSSFWSNHIRFYSIQQYMFGSYLLLPESFDD